LIICVKKKPPRGPTEWFQYTFYECMFHSIYIEIERQNQWLPETKSRTPCRSGRQSFSNSPTKVTPNHLCCKITGHIFGKTHKKQIEKKIHGVYKYIAVCISAIDTNKTLCDVLLFKKTIAQIMTWNKDFCFTPTLTILRSR